MKFEYKKAEDCFSDAENYEYRLEATGSVLVGMLRREAPAEISSLRINEKLRRPTFVAALADGMQVKGLMEKNVIKVGFVPEKVAEQKPAFERWLAGLPT